MFDLLIFIVEFNIMIIKGRDVFFLVNIICFDLDKNSL